MSALSYSKRTNLIKVFLASSDFVFFSVSLFLSIYIISVLGFNVNEFIPKTEMPARLISHTILAVLAIVWFWVRLRHYSYRKPFWFELKEIIRTIVIFSMLDLALVAFQNGIFQDLYG